MDNFLRGDAQPSYLQRGGVGDVSEVRLAEVGARSSTAGLVVEDPHARADHLVDHVHLGTGESAGQEAAGGVGLSKESRR